MDDLHPDSNNARTVKILSDETPDAAPDETVRHMTDEKQADEAADAPSTIPEASAGPANGAVEQPESVPDAADATDADRDATGAQAVVAADAQANHDEADEPPTTDAGQDVPALATTDMPAAPAAEYSTIREVGRDAWGRILLAWRNGEQPDDAQEPPVALLERNALDVEAAQRIIALHLYHARLLAPRAVVARDGGVHWLVVEAPASYEAPFVAIGDGGRMDLRGALKAGVGLANALSYLHTNGVAHERIGPLAVLVHDGRAYLSGIDGAALVETTAESSAARFTADVHALAHLLPLLAGLPEQAPADETALAQAIRTIAARADAGGLVTAEDLAQECGQALQEPALKLPVADESVARAPLVFHCGTATTVGLLRSQNQDALGCAVLDIRDDVGKDRPLGIFLVADGMGGEAAGEIASRIGARVSMAELVRQLLAPTVAMPALEPLAPEHMTTAISVATLAQALSIAVDAANRQVRSLATALQESTGTTLTVIVAAGRQAVLAHLGDSRAYLLHEGTLFQLTKDHSLLARLQELDHPLLNDPSFGMPRNYLYRSLGQEDEAPPDMMEFPLAPGDRLLICSDGLWDELDDETLQRSLTSTDDPTECANHLVRLANAAGGHDNSTAVVVFVEAQPDDPASEISPEQADAILRASGAFDESDDDGEEADPLGNGVVDDAFDMGQG